MSLFSKIEESIERGFRKWTERMFGPADSDDLLLMPVAPAQVMTRIDNLMQGRKPFIVTHDYIGPDRVHVMAGGRSVRSGHKDLALELEEHGYADLGPEVTSDRSASVGATP